MKYFKFLTLFLSLLFFSCEEVVYSYLELYNSSDKEITVKVNDYDYTVKPNDKVKVASSTRETKFEYDGEIQLIKTKEKERFLVSLQGDTIIKTELLYGKAVSYQESLNAEGSTPHQVIKLRNNKYYLPAEVISDKLVIRNFDFSINEDPPSKISSDSDNFKSSPYLKQWKEYYKLYTVDELMNAYPPLNLSKELIEPMVNGLATVLNPDISFNVRSAWLNINLKGQEIGHIGSARVSNDNILELTRFQEYNKKEHGAITEVIIKIPVCNITKNGKVIQEEVSLDVVMSEKTPNPSVIIK